MPRVSFDALPDHGRLWVFPSSRPLDEAESGALLAAVDEFLAQWAAHGAPLRSARELCARQFLVVGVDEDVEAPSGCSIDALVNQLGALGTELGVGLITHGPVWYRDGTDVRTVSRKEFRALADEGAVGPTTEVFDTTLTRVDGFRAGQMERAASQTWHAKAFFRQTTTG